MAHHHRLDSELPERFPFAVHLHRLLAAEDSAEVADEDEKRGLVLRYVGEGRVVAVEVLHEEIGHLGPSLLENAVDHRPRAFDRGALHVEGEAAPFPARPGPP